MLGILRGLLDEVAVTSVELAMAAEGLSSPAIAERLFISRTTVKTHLSAVYRKLAVASRTELSTLLSQLPMD